MWSWSSCLPSSSLPSCPYCTTTPTTACCPAECLHISSVLHFQLDLLPIKLPTWRPNHEHLDKRRDKKSQPGKVGQPLPTADLPWSAEDHHGAAHTLYWPHCGSIQPCPWRRAQPPALCCENRPSVTKHLLLCSATFHWGAKAGRENC